jgi:hypothetical protein
MHVANQKLPFLPGHLELDELAIRLPALVRAAINEGTGLPGVVQDLADPAGVGLAPEQFALLGTGVNTLRKWQPFLAKITDRLQSRTGSLKSVEDPS